MSKLFDTLEKIQHQDDTTPDQEQIAVVVPPAPSHSKFFPFLVGMTVIVAIFAGFQFFSGQQHKPAVAPKTAAQHDQPVAALAKKMTPTAPLPQAPKGSNEDKMIFFNNKGVTMARQGELWQAIYYFDQADRLMPSRGEAAINMGMTLAHLGLQFPAQRYFAKARGINPHNEQLRQAMQTAIANKQINADFITASDLSGEE